MISSAAKARPDAATRGLSSWDRNVNLATELAITQFKLKYTGSLLGYVWSLLKPLVLFAVMWVVFTKLFNTGRSSPNFTMQLLVGVVIWTFFQEATSTAISSIASGGNIIRKAYFPRWILVVASTGTALMTFGINFALIVVITAPLGQLALGPQTLAVPLVMVELYVLILGTSLLLSSLFVFFRDVGHLWELFAQVLFYASAVVYPFSLVQGHSFGFLVPLNPMAQMIEDIRRAMVTPDIAWTVQVSGWLYVVPLATVVGVFVLGAYVFHRLTPRFAEYL